MFVSFVLAGAVVAAQQQLTPAQTIDRRTVGDRLAGDVALSPDDSRVIYTVAEPVKGTAQTRALWRLDVASGQSRQLTFPGYDKYLRAATTPTAPHP